LATSPLDVAYAPSTAATTATETAAIAPGMTMPPPALQQPDEPWETQVSPAGSTLRPVWQMEQFTWPKMCRRLLARAAEELDRFADALIAAKQRGQKVLAISGWHYGEGATTLLLCAARRLAERGIKPALVDADLERPRLARRLGVQPQAGWNQSATDLQGMSLDQVIVEARVNNIALLPACEPSTEGEPSTCDRARLADCIETLREHYDMVLVDLGPLENMRIGLGPAGAGTFHGIDAVVLVRDQRLTTQERLSEIQSQLTSAGITIPGIIENFVDL
jgi:Mrp family chromosome partitioning ATPase